MADQQITQLPEESGTVGAAFPLAIVNTTAAETRKITTANLATAIAANIGAGGLSASKIAAGYSGASLTDGTVTNAKLVSSSVNFGGVSVALGASDTTPAFNLSDATNYPTSSLTGTITNAQLAGSIANSKLANSAVSFGGISVSLGAADATPAFDLTDATNYPTSSLTGTITNAQLAGSIENAKLANSSVSFGGISVALGASDATPAFDLQDATGYKTTNLVGTITNSQLAGSIDASKLVANSLTTDQLGPNCVGASELANNAVDTNSVQDGAIVNDKIQTSTNSSTGIDGATKLRDGSVTASKLNASTVGNGLAINSNVLSINNAISGATSLGLTFSNQGICTGISAIQASDLSGVLATASAIGVVKVPSSGGLSVSGSGDLSLATTITAFNTRGINVNAFGQVLSVSATVPSASLPVSSTTAVGGVKIPCTSAPLTIDGNGILSIGLSGVTAGTGFTKFNVSDKGLITNASGLDASDIPAHSAALLTSGTFDAARIPNSSIDANKLANSAVCQFSGATSTTGVVQFPAGGATTGTFFYDLTNDDLYVYDGNAWQPVTITSGEIIYAGNYRADTNKVTSLSAAGTAQGFTVGAALQAASAANNRYYFVCDKSGTGTSPAPTVTINPPDMILSNGTAWEKLDISNFIAGQSAANISVAPNNGAGGGIHNTNVQSVLEELDTEKLNKTGGTVSGQLLLGNAASLVFEGSSDDAYELTLAVANPQDSDKTLTLPDITGTLITNSDQNTVTSTMVDASLANANIAANAAIALSKIAAVSAGQILVGASGTGTITAVTPTGDIALTSAGAFSYVAGSISNADINASAGIAASKIDQASVSQAGCVQLSSAVTSTSATKAATPAAIKTVNDALTTTTATADAALPKAGGSLSDNLILSNAKQVRFSELTANGSHFVSLQAPDTLAADVSYTLPSAAPTANGQVLASTTGGVLSWTEDPAGQWVTSGNDISYSAGNVTIDTNTFHVDATNNRVGIGLTAPERPLHLHVASSDGIQQQFTNTTTGAGSTDGLVIGLQASEDAVFWQHEDTDIKIATNNNERIRVKNDGKVGINVDDPLEILHCKGSLYLTLNGSTAGEGNALKFQSKTGGFSTSYGAAIHGLRVNDTSSYLRFDTGGQSEVMRLDSSGRLLLGTTTEGNESADELTISNSGNTGITIRSTDSSNCSLFFSDATSGADEYKGYVQYKHSTNALHLGSDGNDSLTLDSSHNATFAGAVQTGDLTILNANPDLKLKDSNHGGNNTEHLIAFQDSSGNNQMNISSPFGEQHLRIKHGSTDLVKIQTDGKIGVGTTSPTSALHLSKSGGSCRIELQRSDANTTGNVGIINFTASDGHSVANMGAYGDGDNEGAYLSFKTTSAAAQNSPFESGTKERLRIQSGGDVKVTDGNLVIGTAGHGIDFSAQTASSATGATANGELLDHFEEGTWTPVQPTVGWYSGAEIEGKYQRVGHWVTATFIVKFPDNGSGVQALIDGLPFVSGGSGDAGRHGGSVSYTTDSNVNSFLVGNGQDRIYTYNSSGGAVQLSPLDNDEVRGTVIYRVS